MFGAECQNQNGLHFMASEILFPEIIDINTGRSINIDKGVIGELVLTNLSKQAQPLVRYKTNDIIKILSVGKCNCGENGVKFEFVGRSDDMLVIKGLNVFISAIDDIVNKFLNKITRSYQIHINKQYPIDRILLKIEIKNDCVKETEKITNEIKNDFIIKLNINPEIIVLNEGSLPLTEGKIKKVFRTL